MIQGFAKLSKCSLSATHIVQLVNFRMDFAATKFSHRNTRLWTLKRCKNLSIF